MDTPMVGKMPTHAIVATTDDYKNKITVGKLWLKESEYGNFLSGEMSKESTHEGKTYKGYSIVEDGYLNALKETIKNLEAQIPKSEFTKAIEKAYDKPLENQIF